MVNNTETFSDMIAMDSPSFNQLDVPFEEYDEAIGLWKDLQELFPDLSASQCKEIIEEQYKEDA